MAKTIYLEKNGGNFEYFICNFFDDDKKSVPLGNRVVACQAFKNADSVEVVIFDKCGRIEEFAFENCTELKTVIWNVEKDECIDDSRTPRDNEVSEREQTGNDLGIMSPKVHELTIQHGAFRNCSKLQTVILPDVSGRIVIEKEAFAGCGSLRTVVFFGSRNVEVGEDAFVSCSKVSFLCSCGSSVERYAREHGFRIVNF